MLVLLAAAWASVRGAGTPPPHIVLYVVDDLGWGDVGFHRNVPTAEVNTPTIDALVQDGIELGRHYVASSCSPSRAALISGRFPPHVNGLLQEPWVSNPRDTVSGWQVCACVCLCVHWFLVPPLSQSRCNNYFVHHLLGTTKVEIARVPYPNKQMVRACVCLWA